MLRQQPRPMLIVFACLLVISLAQSCVPEVGATWPKLIGYGLSDTTVESVNRCSTSGELVFALKSKEDEFIKKVPKKDNLLITTFNPDTEQYGWFKVIENIKYNGMADVRYTPDCSKILIYYEQKKPDHIYIYVFLNAITGEKFDSFSKNRCCARIYTDDEIVISNSSDRIYSITKRDAEKTVIMNMLEYSTATQTFTNFQHRTWKYHMDAAQSNGKFQRPSITVSPDDSRVFTFSTGDQDIGTAANDCAMYIWDKDFTESSLPLLVRNEKVVQNRHCRYPFIYEQPADGDGTVYLAIQLTEYYSENKAGMIRSKLNSAYTFVEVKDDELLFEGYQVVFRGAYYPSATVAYAMATDKSININYLIKFDWTASKGELWRINGFDNSPNNALSNGSKHLGALIYEENLLGAANGNFPIKGYIVGATKAIWTFNSLCNEPDFGVTLSYMSLFKSPIKYGYVERIEMDESSCRREEMTVTQVALQSGQGRNDAEPLTESPTVKSETDNTFGFPVTLWNLSDASLSGISPGDWEKESSLKSAYSECKARSASLNSFIFTDPVFDSDDQVEYEISSGLYEAPITTDWKIQGDTCNMPIVDYRTHEKLQATGTTSSNLALVSPTTSSKKVGLQTSDKTQNQVVHTVTVLAVSATWQCAKKSFQVRPYYCALSTYSAAQWTTSTSLSLALDYELGTTIGDEILQFTISEPRCANEVQLLEIDQFSAESLHAGSVVTLTQDMTISSPQFGYNVQINNADMSLDPGSGLAPPTQTFNVVVSSPDRSSAVAEGIATNPVIYSLVVTYKHPCRSVTIQDQVISSMSTKVLDAMITQSVAFVLSPALPTCFTETVQIISAASYPFLSYNSSTKQLEVQTNDFTKIGVYTGIQIRFKLDSAYLVSYDKVHQLTVSIGQPCQSETFIPGAVWDKTGTSVIPEYERKLLAGAEIYSYQEVLGTISQAYPGSCTTQYTFVQQWSANLSQWVEYQGPVFTLNSLEKKVVIDSSNLQKDLIGTTLKFRMAIASVQNLSDALNPAIWELTVKLVNPVDPCPLMTLEFTQNFRMIESSELASQTKTASVPQLEITPDSVTDCGPYTYELIINDAEKIKDLLLLQTNGTITLSQPSYGHAGFYSPYVRVSLQNYPNITARASVQISISRCKPERILAPEDPLRFAQFQISDPGVELYLSDFILEPPCTDVTLQNQLLFASGYQLPRDFGLQFEEKWSKYALYLNTTREAYQGQHLIMVGVISPYDSTVRANYTFVLDLIKPVNDAPYFEDDSVSEDQVLVKTFNATSSIIYVFPAVVDTQNDNVKIHVTLNESAADYFLYDDQRKEVKQQSSEMRVPRGTYELMIKLIDDNPVRPLSSSYKLLIIVIDTVVEPICCLEKYAIPRIKSITTSGLLTIAWDRQMMQPQNETWYAEQLQEEILVDKLHSEQVRKLSTMIIPALEVTFEPSYSQHALIENSWSFVEWSDPQEMKIQLTFDKPELVSMEIPMDKIRITFWNQQLFIAKDGSYVERAKTIEKEIWTQTDSEDFAQIGKILIVSVSVVTIAGCCLSSCSIFSMALLWSMLNTIQLMVHLPIFTVQFPGIAFIVYEQIIYLAKFELVKTEDIATEWFELDANEVPFSPEFERLEFERKTILSGSGLFLPFFFFALIPLLISTCLNYPAKRYQAMASLKWQIDKRFKWNYTLRLLFEATLDIAILAIMDTFVCNWDSWGYQVSFGTSIFFLCALVGQALGIGCCLRRLVLNDPLVIARYGSLYEGLIQQAFTLSQPQWFIYRRIIFAASAFYGIGKLWISFQVLFFSSLISMALIWWRKGYQLNLVHFVELCNEGFLLMVQYHLFLFTDFVPEAETRSLIAYSCVVFTISCIVFNIIITSFTEVISLRLWLRRCLNRRWHMREQKKLEQIIKKNALNSDYVLPDRVGQIQQDRFGILSLQPPFEQNVPSIDLSLYEADANNGLSQGKTKAQPTNESYEKNPLQALEDLSKQPCYDNNITEESPYNHLNIPKHEMKRVIPTTLIEAKFKSIQPIQAAVGEDTTAMRQDMLQIPRKETSGKATSEVRRWLNSDGTFVDGYDEHRKANEHRKAMIERNNDVKAQKASATQNEEKKAIWVNPDGTFANGMNLNLLYGSSTKL